MEKMSPKLVEGDEGGFGELEVDVLRAMVLLHGYAWKPDLHDTLSTIWRLKGLDFNQMVEASELIPKVLEKLCQKRILRFERRLRGDLSRSEPLEDTLYCLENERKISETLSSDPIVLRYRKEIMGYDSLKF
jgi:hypothetical protein